jgi:hypothetical protein
MDRQLTAPLFLNVRKRPIFCKARVYLKSPPNPAIRQDTWPKLSDLSKLKRRIRSPPQTIGCLCLNIPPKTLLFTPKTLIENPITCPEPSG